MLIAALLFALSTGAQLDSAGRTIDVGNLPLSMTMAPEGDRAVVVLSGFREMGVQVVDLAAGSVTQTIPLRSAFIGAAFSPDGKSLYISGGEDDVVHVYSWANREATFARDINLKLTEKDAKGSRYPAGIATSRDGRFLYVAENVADDVAVIDAASFAVVARIKTDHYPYAIAVAPNGDVFASAWGANTVSLIRDNAEVQRIEVGRHPSALRLNADGSKLYVALASVDQIAIIDTKCRAADLGGHDEERRPGRRHTCLSVLHDNTPAGPHEGTTPNALALSPDGSRLYVAEGDNNAVAVFDTASRKRLGRIPAGWYPSDVIATSDHLFILNSKGRGSKPNPGASHPGRKRSGSYTLATINGTISVVDHPLKGLASMTQRVAKANHWRSVATRRRFPPFKHVIYIIKENRTFDQVFGDMKSADADPSLLFFGRDVSPNHHALADRFGLFDRFFTSGEVSQQGHIWSTAAYVTDYTEKTVHSLYAHKRADIDEHDVEDPAVGYLWTRVAQKGITLRNYGEFGDPIVTKSGYVPLKPGLAPYTNPDYPPFDLDISDQHRADIWMHELAQYVATNTLPALEIMHLPNDHCWGAKANKPAPRSYMADNDMALARIVSAISKTRYWRDTVIFVVEDDAQDGPDHVDSHRSVMFAISAYNRPGVQHRFTNTTDVVATIEQILGLAPMSQFDYYGRPLDDVFASTPDLTPYEPILPTISLHDLNPPDTEAAKKSASLDMSRPDAADENEANRVLWMAVKGADVPYPEPRHGSTYMWLFGGR
jgi:YVTN family beta-propeller protein